MHFESPLVRPFSRAHDSAMNVTALQLDIAWEDKHTNFDKIRRLMDSAAPSKNSLVVLPEMFATGFSMNDVAEVVGGETSRFIANLAGERGICIVAGAAIRGDDGRARNCALAYSPGGQPLVTYAKMRPFTPGGEARHYVAGQSPAALAWEGWTIALFVCYDLRFPEIFRLVTARSRPDLFVVIANWPQRRVHHWVRLLQARAIENQAWVVGVNRCGRDPDHVYNGRTVIVDYHGELIADAGETEGWIKADLSLDALRKYRLDVPFLDDMRSVHIDCGA
jgi:predicted amidohydrolase